MRLVPISSVKEGIELGKTIFDSDGRVLLAKGTELSEKLLKRVESNGIMSIYINDEYSTNEIEDVIKPELRQRSKKIVRESFNKFLEISEKNTITPLEAQKLSNESLKNINS